MFLHTPSHHYQLVNIFYNLFSCNKSFNKLTSDLYRISQESDESLREYLSRFKNEALNIPYLEVETVVGVLNMGPKKDSPFYEDLMMTPCRKLD